MTDMTYPTDRTDVSDVTDTSAAEYRSNEMYLIHENLARAQMAERLGEAHDRQPGHDLARARRLSRKAERAAQQARLALARLL